MTQHLLQVNFHFQMPVQEYEDSISFIAEKFVHGPGLVWKIWLMSEDRKEAGGIYLFSSREALLSFRKSILFRNMEANGSFSQISVREFSLPDHANLITNAPVYPLSILSRAGASN